MSSYQGFAVVFRTSPGDETSVGAGVEVLVRAEGEGADEPESPLTTDSNGEIAAGTLAGVAAGTRVFFRVEEFQGMAASVAQLTT
jgi:hypothetical protein